MVGSGLSLFQDRPRQELDDDASLGYAELADGSHWTRPDLGLVEYHGNKTKNMLSPGTQARYRPGGAKELPGGGQTLRDAIIRHGY